MGVSFKVIQRERTKARAMKHSYIVECNGFDPQRQEEAAPINTAQSQCHRVVESLVVCLSVLGEADLRYSACILHSISVSRTWYTREVQRYFLIFHSGLSRSFGHSGGGRFLALSDGDGIWYLVPKGDERSMFYNSMYLVVCTI